MRLKPERIWLRLEPWLPAVVVLIALVVWEILALSGAVSRLFFPPPSSILAVFWKLIISGKIWPHLGATIGRLTLGFCTGGLIGLLLGITMGWSSRLRNIADPIIAALHPIPKIAIFPLIMIIFGIGEASKIVAVAIAAFFPMLINSMAGVHQINPIYFEVAQNFKANRWKTFTRVILPGSLPMILTGARLALNMSLVITIAVELISADLGLGEMIWFAWQTLRIEELYASLIAISLVGIMLNAAIQRLSDWLTPWYEGQSKHSGT